jgi:hypothetical protein
MARYFIHGKYPNTDVISVVSKMAAIVSPREISDGDGQSGCSGFDPAAETASTG